MKTVEDIKTGSHGLRGGIEEALKDSKGRDRGKNW